MAERIEATTIAVLADCHIHPGGGIDWPQAVLDALAGVDLIVTLGDMGEGLGALAEIAPVMGVRGADDADDPRAAETILVLEEATHRIGCVFDPVAAGVAISKDPLVLADGETLRRVFGGRLNTLLWASTHTPSFDVLDDIMVINPGSATLPDKGSAASFALLESGHHSLAGKIVEV
jgi:putative phosphoesterase